MEELYRLRIPISHRNKLPESTNKNDGKSESKIFAGFGISSHVKQLKTKQKTSKVHRILIYRKYATLICDFDIAKVTKIDCSTQTVMIAQKILKHC